MTRASQKKALRELEKARRALREIAEGRLGLHPDAHEEVNAARDVLGKLDYILFNHPTTATPDERSGGFAKNSCR